MDALRRDGSRPGVRAGSGSLEPAQGARRAGGRRRRSASRISARARSRRRLPRAWREPRYDLVYASSTPMAQYARGLGVPVVMDFVDVDSDKWTQYAGTAGRRSRGSTGSRAGGCRPSEARHRALGAASACSRPPAEETLLQVLRAVGADRGHSRTGSISSTSGPPSAGPHPRRDLHRRDGLHAQRGRGPVLLRRDPASRAPARVAGHAVLHRRTESRPPDGARLGEMPGRHRHRDRAGRAALLRAGVGLRGAACGLAAACRTRCCRRWPWACRSWRAASRSGASSAEPGEHLHVEDDPAAFASLVVRLLRSPEERLAMGRRARAFVEGHHAWDSSGARLDAMIRSLGSAARGAVRTSA